MITRIEIDGFKSFSKFVMDFSPMTVVAGANASGKSNLFDALQLLSSVSEYDLRHAFGQQRGLVRELFTQYSNTQSAEQIHFGVELLVNRTVKDDWGREATLKYTRLRYELTIARTINTRGLEELLVKHEELYAIRPTEDAWIALVPKAIRNYWRPPVITGGRAIPYISSREVANGERVFVVPRDGNAGKGLDFPMDNATRTVLSGISSAEFPHALAAREEIRSWKFLQLNPASLSKPTQKDLSLRDTITRDGENLAATLHRIKITDSYSLKLISRRLNNLLPSLTEVEVEDDQASNQYIIKIRSEDGRVFSSRVLSEGTLRLLALCVFQFDDLHQGLLCFEEPENGIHPARLREMADLLLALSVDFSEEGNPLRQVIINTHSPELVREFFLAHHRPKLNVWFAQLTTRTREVEGRRIKLSATRLLPVETEVTQGALGVTESPERKLVLGQLIRYLNSDDPEKTLRELGLYSEEAAA